MSNLDTKVVEMRFDNKNFETNVKTSMSSLDKLKEKLTLPGASKGLENINDAAKKVNMSGISGAVDTIKLSFSNLEVMAVTALVNITNAAINVGKKITSAIMAPIMEGGKRRALNIEQAKFQFEGLKMDVEATMADANYAVDGTAYSLDAAAKVASQLGASGMRAGEDMRRSLRAVSGVAAMAGSSYEDIGNVFTKVAGQGRVMGDDLLRLSARGINAAATIAKELNITEAEVRAMVTAGQVDFKMFSEAMDSAFGEHATAANKTFTGSLSNVKSALARIGEKFYTPFHKNLIDPLNAFRVVINDVNKALSPLFDVLEKIMIKMSGKIVEKLEKISLEKLGNFIQLLVDGNDTTKKIGRTFKGLWAVLGLVKDAFKFVFDVVKEVIGLFGGAKFGNSILDLAAKFGDYLVKLRDTTRENELFKKSFEKIKTALEGPKEALTNLADKIKDAIVRIKDAFKGFGKVDLDPLDDFSKKTEKKIKPLTTLMEIVGSVFEFIVKTIEWIAPAIKKIASSIGNAIVKFASTFKDKVKNIEFKDILELINTGLFGMLIKGFRDFTKNLTDLTGGLDSMMSNVAGLLTDVRGVLQSYQETLKAKTLKTIATAIAILAASLFVISLIDPDKILDAMMAISMLFVELSASLIVLNTSLKEVKMKKLSSQLIGFSAAILILSFAMKNLASLSWEGVGKGIVGIGALSAMLVLTAQKLGNKEIRKNLKAASQGIIIFSAAMLIMVQSVKQLAKLSWEELAKGLAGVTVILSEIVIFTRLLDAEKNNIPKIGGTLIALGVALTIFSVAIRSMAKLSWDQLARGMTAFAGALTVITLALKYMPSGDELKGKASSLLGISVALVILGTALRIMSKMSWEEVSRGLTALGGALLVLSLAMESMKGIKDGAVALLIAAPALLLLVAILKKFAGMAFSEIGKALLFIAGVFVIFGAAAYALGPKIEILQKLSNVVLKMGLGFAAIGVGLLALSTGIATTSLSIIAVTKTIYVIFETLLSLIPMFFRKIAEGILEFGKILTSSITVLSDIIKALISAACSALRESIPEVVDTLLVLILGILTALDEHLPAIVDKLFSVVISFLDKVAENLPELIKVGVKLLAAFFNGLVEALGDLDVANMLGFYAFLTTMVGTFVLLSKLKSNIKDALITAGAMVLIMGMIAALYYMIGRLNIRYMEEMAIALSSTMIAMGVVIAIIGNLPLTAALMAVTNLGIFITGFTAILLALGGIAQIPGFKWLLGEGGKILATLGTIIGNAIGSIISGLISTVFDTLPKIATNLSEFMVNIQPFIEGAKTINKAVAEGILILAGVLLALTATSIVNGLTSWLTGGSSFTSFGKQLAEFGPYFAQYYDSIKNVDAKVVEASANAAKSLAELGKYLPKQGGLVQWFAGSSTLTAFAEELVNFGPAIKKYGDSVKHLDSDAVIGSANAAMALAELGKKLPKQGGVVQWFTGANTLTAFALELKEFGPAIKQYSDSVKYVKSDAVIGSAKAAESLAELGKKLPKQSGIAQWFTGANTLTKFAKELQSFGPAIKEYGDSVAQLKSDAVIGSAKAAESLAELGKKLPKQGGIVNWFTGSNTLTKFAKELKSFGPAIKEYGDSIAGFDADAVIGSAKAAESLVKLSDILPDQGGIKQWFTGSNTLTKFAKELETFGPSMKSYSDSITDFDSEAVTASANAAKSLAELGDILPKTGGIQQWFTGSVDLADFGKQLAAFGGPLKEFSESVTGIKSNVVETAAIAVKALGEMVEYIPATTGGIKQWYTGSVDLGDFGKQLVAFGGPLKEFSEEVDGVKTEVASNAALMAKSLGEMAEHIPATTGGIKQWFSGSVDFKKFGEELVSFGPSLKTFAESVDGIPKNTAETSSKMAESLGVLAKNIPVNTNGVFVWFTGKQDIVKFGEELAAFGPYLFEYAQSIEDIPSSIADKSKTMIDALIVLAEGVPKTGGLSQIFTGTNDIKTFGEHIKAFGESLWDYFRAIEWIDISKFTSATDGFTKLIGSMSGVNDIDMTKLAQFSSNLTALANNGIDNFISAFDDSENRIEEAAFSLVTIFMNAVNQKKSDLTTAFVTVMDDLIKVIDSKKEVFKARGEALMVSFKDGAKAKTQLIKDEISDIVSAMVLIIELRYYKMKIAGKEIMENFIDGLNWSTLSKPEDIFKSLLDKAITAISNKVTSFYNSGVSLVTGFINGIKSKETAVKSAATSLGNVASKALNNSIAAKSPSKVAYGIGGYFGEGFVTAILDYGDRVYEASSEMGDLAKQGLTNAVRKIKDLVENGIDTQPTIRPVLDLSNVKTGSKTINSLLSSKQAMSIGMGMAYNQSVNEEKVRLHSGAGNTYSFVQNNYSPKPLSRLEIYRQTKNQFSALKGLVDA